MNNFYVYAYLDPRKEGRLIYGTHIFGYEPFYIGKGFNTRMNRHLTPSCLEHDTNTIKKNKIKHIIEAGYNLKDGFIIKIRKDMTEQDALNLEINMIKMIGRLNIKTGPLANLTEGGDGVSGWIPSEETKRKIGLTNSHASLETREKLRKANLGKRHSEETKRKIGITSSRRRYSNETKEKHRIAMIGNKNGLGYRHTLEEIEKIRQSSLRRYRKFKDSKIINKILSLRKNGMVLDKLAKEFNCSTGAIITVIKNYGEHHENQ